jgi:hypothetical protein
LVWLQHLVKFPQGEIARICRTYGSVIKGLAASFDGPTLLWAISGNETSFGANCVPRHEIEYCTQSAWHRKSDGTFEFRRGRYSMHNSAGMESEHAWGCWAHASYGPWQLMFANAQGYTPDELEFDLEKAAEATVGFLNRKIAELQPKTLPDIARLWNGSQVSAQYIIDLTQNYSAGLPPEPA